MVRKHVGMPRTSPLILAFATAALGFGCPSGDEGSGDDVGGVTSCASEMFLVDIDGHEEKYPYCIEYTGSLYTDQTARLHCEAQMSTGTGVTSSPSPDACPLDDLLGCCTVLVGQAEELKYCFYDAELAAATSRSCDGTWADAN